jgi:hypothetical protein
MYVARLLTETRRLNDEDDDALSSRYRLAINCVIFVVVVALVVIVWSQKVSGVMTL